MMATKGVVLHASSLIGSSASIAKTWEGGRASLVISANTFGSGVFLEVFNENTGGGTDRWVPINGTAFSANQVTAYDLPAGQYRMVNQGSSSINLNAKLVSVPYGG